MNNLPSVDPDMAGVLCPQNDILFDIDELLRESPCKSERTKSLFEIPPSKKDRGKPYYVDSTIRVVMTKSGSHFPVRLTGIQMGDSIRTRVLYDHEDFQTDRVKCDNTNSGHTSVFEVEPRTRGLEVVHQPNDSELCSKTLFYKGTQNDVTYRFVAKCLNSCTKVCSERIVAFEHFGSNGELLETSIWSLRVCSIPKRDFEFMIDSVDPTTGEKRKSLYSKVKEKKIKFEDKDVIDRTPDQQENDQSEAYLGTKEDTEAVIAAAEWVTNVPEHQTSDVPISTVQADAYDFIINVSDTEVATSLLEEKQPLQTYKTVTEPTDAPPASMPSRPPMYVQLNSIEDEKLVRKLIHRLNGTVHELKLASS